MPKLSVEIAVYEKVGSVSNLTTFIHKIVNDILAHQRRRLGMSLYDGTRAGVRVSVRASTLSNMNILETSRPIVIKFYLEHHWDGGLVALGLGPDWIRTLVSMAK